MRTWLRLLTTRPRFLRLWLSGSVSLVGDWLSFVAVSLLSLQGGGGPVSLALMLAAHALPHALLAPLAGSLADRMDRVRLLVVANLVQAALTAAMVGAAASGAIGLVQLLLLVRSGVSAFVVPAEAAVLPRVVEPDELVPANALVSATWSLTFVAGMALGGALAVLGPTLALAIDAGTFVVAALLLRSLPAIVAARTAAATDRGATIEALRYAMRRGPLLEAVLAKTPVALAGGAAWVTLNLVADRVTPFGSAALSLGILQAVRGAGTGIGPLLAAGALGRSGSMERLNLVSFFAALAGMAAFAAGGGAAALLVAALVWGLGSGSNWVLSSSEIQRLAPDRFLGRLAAIDDLCVTVGQVTAALIGAVVAASVGPAAATWIGLALGLAGWLAARLLARRAPIAAPHAAES